MNFRFLRALSCLAVIGLSISAYGQDSTRFTFGGSVDTYFHSSFGLRNGYPSDGDGGYNGSVAPNTSFADGKGFSIGMVNLIASYAGEKVGFTADVVFGPRGKAAVFGTASGQAIINQAFVYYKLGKAVTLNLGQFNTFLGYEVISPAVNFHYSTSYLFSWGPFNHTGLRADFDLGNGFVGKLAIMNPTDIVEFNPVNTYTAGLQLGKTTDAGGIWFNFLYGDQDGTLDADIDGDGATSRGNLFQADITTGWNLTDAFYLGVNASYQMIGDGEVVNGTSVNKATNTSSSFAGIAVYPKVTLSENFALGLRAEYFSIKDSHLNIIALDDGDTGDGSVMEFTLSGNYKVGGLTFIPEIRIDKTSENTFYKKDDVGTITAPDKTLFPTLNLAAVYKF
ncbi:outer membrane beta-barrel protein [Chryseolinea sp. T2]|uniref:outer membrane beta-barrel protein n=1 Tax=Chryseolinea sp. T2 TaxID=3129255 RepID=UPI003076DCB5